MDKANSNKPRLYRQPITEARRWFVRLIEKHLDNGLPWTRADYVREAEAADEQLQHLQAQLNATLTAYGRLAVAVELDVLTARRDLARAHAAALDGAGLVGWSGHDPESEER